jgi:hypothetical protein
MSTIKRDCSTCNEKSSCDRSSCVIKLRKVGNEVERVIKRIFNFQRVSKNVRTK